MLKSPEKIRLLVHESETNFNPEWDFHSPWSFNFRLNLPCKHELSLKCRSGLKLNPDSCKLLLSCRQSCCKLIVKTCFPQVCCKSFQQVVTSLQMASWNKPDVIIRVDKLNRQVCCNLLTTCNKSVKLTTCNKSVAVLATYKVEGMTDD